MIPAGSKKRTRGGVRPEMGAWLVAAVEMPQIALQLFALLLPALRE